MKIQSLLFVSLSFSMVFAAETLHSRAFQKGKTLGVKQVANVFGCNGQNMSPDLSWKGLSKDAKSYAVTVYDPDAPTGSGFWHWIAYDINANVLSLKEGASGKTMPAGSVEAVNDYGTNGYGGACPPEGHGKHRYILTVHALKVEKLPVPQGATSAVTRFIINANTIEKASVEAVYSR